MKIRSDLILGELSAADDMNAMAEICYGLRALRYFLVRCLLETADTDEKITRTKDIFHTQNALATSRARIRELELLDLRPSFSQILIPDLVDKYALKPSKEAINVLVGTIRNLIQVHLINSHVGNGPTFLVLEEIFRQISFLEVDELFLDVQKEKNDNTIKLIEDWWKEGKRSPLLEIPARDKILTVLSSKEAGWGDGSDLAFLHGKIFNIEITASEICATMLEKFEDLPNELEANLARQCWDEGRHAYLLLDQLRLRGGKIGQFPVQLQIWNNFCQAQDIAEALGIEQVIGEGHALGCDLEDRDRFLAKGDQLMARLCEWIYLDEIEHVRQGLSWFRRLKGKIAAQDMEALEKRFPSFIPSKLNVPLRRKIGFSGAEISRLQSRIK